MIGAVSCFHCGTSNSFAERLSLRAECEKCGNDLHVCKNCRFYDPGAYNECKESSAEEVRDKERSNHCDYFQAGSGSFQKDKKDELMAQAEALFKKK